MGREVVEEAGEREKNGREWLRLREVRCVNVCIWDFALWPGRQTPLLCHLFDSQHCCPLHNNSLPSAVTSECLQVNG